MNCKEFFNLIAATWDHTVHHDSNKIEILLDRLDICEGQRVLDIGCGTGILIPFLAERVGSEGFITCIDISDEMIKIASNKYQYPHLSFIVGDIHEVNLEEKSHIAICYSAFPHFIDKKIAILNIRDLLLPGGKLAIMHSQSREEINRLHRQIGKGLEKHLLPPAKELEKLMAKCGLKPLISLDNEEMYLVVGEKTQIHTP